MRRKPRPAAPDIREPWQIEQAAHCPCRGTDDMCPCQNENPWPRPRRDYEGEVRTLELQQQTDRETIANLLSRLTASEERERLLREALERIGTRARSDGQRTFDDCIRDLGWIDDECRRLRLQPEGEKG